MVARRMIAGLGLGALVVTGFAVAPAIGAPGDSMVRFGANRPISPEIGSFTPAAADPMLASVLARAGLRSSSFRFTPTDSHKGARAVTVAVRARTTRVDSNGSPASPVALAPIAYSLGTSVGWKRFALSGDMARVDLAGSPISRQNVDVGVSYSGRRFSGQVRAIADRPLPNAPKLVADVPSYSVDVSSSYKLTRNLDVTAGVRYKSERDRLQQIEEDKRDSQAVYIGTAFRF
ncbi:hypothetical protein BH09PSE4_BH09PSE4_02870 [soil metagenome]